MSHRLRQERGPAGPAASGVRGRAAVVCAREPLFEASTAEMRAALPKTVPMSSQIHNAAMGGSLVRRKAISFFHACQTATPSRSQLRQLRRQKHSRQDGSVPRDSCLPVCPAPSALLPALLCPALQPVETSERSAAPAQVAAICSGDAALLGRALDSDIIVEPVRGALIPGFRCERPALW